MKLLRYGPMGMEKPGLLDAGGKIRDLSGLVGDIGGETLSDAGLDRLRTLDTAKLPEVDPSVRLGPCVGGTGKFICIGLNYSDHAAETGAKVPSEPIIFMKATSAICGPDDPVIIPRGSEKTDWEVELGFVIGKRAKYVSEADAMGHVAGLEAHELAEVADQERHAVDHGGGRAVLTLLAVDAQPHRQLLGVGHLVAGDQPRTGRAEVVGRLALGPLALPLGLEGALGDVVDHAVAGDVVSTGTPPGVGMGMKPPRYLKAGDVIELGVEGLGRQRQVCIDDPD